MTSEVKERPRLVTGCYERHRSQWVKIDELIRSLRNILSSNFPCEFKEGFSLDIFNLLFEQH